MNSKLKVAAFIKNQCRINLHICLPTSRKTRNTNALTKYKNTNCPVKLERLFHNTNCNQMAIAHSTPWLCLAVTETNV